jgi:hypothetical protein
MKTKNFLNHIDQLAEEHELTRQQILEAFKKSLIFGCKKNYQIKSCHLDFDKKYEEFFLYKEYLVTEEEINTTKEENINTKKITCINLEEAQKLKENPQIGEIIRIEVDPNKFNFYDSQEFKNKLNEEIIKFKKEKYENKLIYNKAISMKKIFFILESKKEVQALLLNKDKLNNNYESILRQIIITSILSALSVAIQIVSNKFMKGPFFRPILKSTFVDFLCFIPLLIIPLYAKKNFAFIGAFLSESISFWYKKTSVWVYNPILSLIYGFIWGILPGLVLTKKKDSLLKIYFSITFIFIMHFIFYYILRMIWFKFVFLDQNYSLNLKANIFNLERLNFYYLFIKFISLFILSFIMAFIYNRAKKELLSLF